MYTQKKSTTHKKNIDNYKNYKVIKTWEKPRSPIRRVWLTNDPDEWLIDVLHVLKKSGKIRESEGWITAKEMDNWAHWYKSLGWKEV